MKEGVLQVSQLSQRCLQIRLRLFIVTLSLLEISCIGRSNKKNVTWKSHDVTWKGWKSHDKYMISHMERMKVT